MLNTMILQLFIFSLAFVFNYGYDADAIAQAACAGRSPGGFVAAVRRDCGVNKPTCSTVCQNAITGMRAIYGQQGSTSSTCFEAFHFYYKHATLTPDEKGKPLMAMYRYGIGGCQHTSCGPNFCCCRA
uniref:Uncharacterized protein LOC111111892 n=1 Tax=Crassostrea virginica TaxID=6565 RepID=A0A8B8BPJ8_CRAVI|nr:uncharacterized protein LOC111111892 [Crassostrea virginica]XP_022304795.1 uncharacterized protein LOC111111893 [Crassostrea virginica]